MRVPAADLDEFAALSALGIDSLTAVELRSWVQGDLEVELAVEQMFTTPSIRELAIVIGQHLGESQSDGTTSATANGALAHIGEATAQWLVCPQLRSEARLRLICFPYAGGGASAFKDWADAIPDDVELCVVQMPGREERLREPLLTDMSTLVQQLTDELRVYTDRPYAFLGHSMGAIVCYEVACRLRALGAASVSYTHLTLPTKA